MSHSTSRTDVHEAGDSKFTKATGLAPPESGTTEAEANTEKTPAAPLPFSAGFFDRDPETTRQRNAYLKTVIPGGIFVILVIFGVMSIYWGSLWRVSQYVHNLNGWIVDFDGGAIGQAVARAFTDRPASREQITWQVVDASQFPSGPGELEGVVVNERSWVVISINPGATAALNAAAVSADISYNGSSAITAYAAEARNENSFSMFVMPDVTRSLNMVSTTFAMEYARELATSGTIDVGTLLATAPMVVTQPVYYTINNVRPFDVPVAVAVDFVGLIYLLILSFILTMMNANAMTLRSGLAQHLRTSSLLKFRIVSPLVLYFFISWFYSLLSLAFQAPFNRRYGHSGFVIFWAMNWMGMSALGLAMEAMVTLLTPSFTPFFLVLWIIVNVSVSLFPIELLPRIFHYGYATPFYNVSRTVRTILFSTRDQIGLNFGIQFLWIAISLITIPAFQYLERKRAIRKHREQFRAGVDA